MTPKDVAEFMVAEMGTDFYYYLDQKSAVHRIRERFGDEFIYVNRNGNAAIDKRVLDEFNLLTKDRVVWERKRRWWRRREPYDPPGREV